MTEAATQLQEIKDLIRTISQDNKPIARSVTDWVANTQKSCSPKLNQARVALFFAHHGFAQTLKITDQTFDKYVKENIDGTGKLNRLCQASNLDLRLYELDTETPTADCQGGDSAMETEDMVKAIAYGMMSVEPGLDLIAATSFGHGSETSARALLALHNGQTPDDLTVTRLLKNHAHLRGFEALQAIGGYELAALCGLVIAARLAQIPVLLEGETGSAILAILKHENLNSVDHAALTGWTEPKEVSNIPFYALPHAAPKEPGLALTCLIPVLKNQIILQG